MHQCGSDVHSGRCDTYHCYKGGPAEGLGQETDGCPLYSHPAHLADNRDCVLCMVCLKVLYAPHPGSIVSGACQSIVRARILQRDCSSECHDFDLSNNYCSAGLPAQERRVSVAHSRERPVVRPRPAAGGGQPPVHAARRRRGPAVEHGGSTPAHCHTWLAWDIRYSTWLQAVAVITR